MLNNKPNRELLYELDDVVIGHTKAKKALINLVNRSQIRHYQRHVLNEHTDSLIPTGKCLLVGGSGTGKTYLVETLSKLITFPLIKVDATKFNPTGAGGGMKSTDLVARIKANAQNLTFNKAYDGQTIQGILDQTVVFVDEMDKLASNYEGNTGGSWQTHTQTNFLTIFESKDQLDGVSFVFAGAFSGIEEIVGSEKQGIGFNPEEADEAMIITDEHIIKYGMIPELVGRIGQIIQLDKLTREHYEFILLHQLIPKKTQDLVHFNCADLQLSEEDITNILDKTEQSGQGVRCLKRELDEYLLDVEFDYEETTDHRLLLENLIEKYGGEGNE